MYNRKLHLFLYSFIILSVSSIPGNSLNMKFNLGYDKIIHFIEYSLLGVFCLRSKIKFYKSSYLFTFIFGLIFGIIDEFWQSFIPGRHSSIFDIAADLSGICFILILFKYFPELEK